MERDEAPTLRRADSRHLRRRTTYFHVQSDENDLLDQYAGESTGDDLPPDDLVDLLGEDLELVSTALTRRYQLSEYSTALHNQVLICFNPFKPVDIFSDGYKESYAFADLDHPQERYPPHPYEVAERSWRTMCDSGKDQMIMITGESGSGKTEMGKFLFDYLLTRSTQHVGKGDIEVMEEWTSMAKSGIFMLDTFGCAGTALNANSTRFMKWTTVQMDEQGAMKGFEIKTSLLETSRLVNRPTEARSFHVFYYLLAGSTADELKRLGLTQYPSDYRILCEFGKDEEILWSTDARNLDKLRESMELFGITSEEQAHVRDVLAAILHLGNIEFTDLGSDDTIYALHYSSLLLGYEADTFLDHLTQSPPARSIGADSVRDGLMRNLYECLFGFLVSRINYTTECRDDPTTVRNVHLMDFFGFEVLDTNSFEQFVINMINESIHNHCNNILFVRKQREYEEDGVMWEHVDFFDNTACMQVLVGNRFTEITQQETVNGGITLLLDQETQLGQEASDSALLEQMHGMYEQDDFYILEGETMQPSHEFGIRHYAADVVYDVSEFTITNSVAADRETLRILELSGLDFLLKELLPFSIKYSKDATRIAYVIEMLYSWMNICEKSTPWFVRCVKPNHYGKPGEIDSDFVLSQIEYLCTCELVKIHHKGYPIHTSFVDFFLKYDLIRYTKEGLMARQARGKDFRQTMTDLQPKCLDILQFAMKQFPDHQFDKPPYQIGLSQLYFTPPMSSILDHLLNQKRDFWANEIQRVWRGYHYCRKHLPAIKAARAKELAGPTVLQKIGDWFSGGKKDEPDSAKSHEQNSNSAWDALNPDFTLNSTTAGNIEYQRRLVVLGDWISELTPARISLAELPEQEAERELMERLRSGRVLIDLMYACFPELPSLEELDTNLSRPDQCISLFLDVCDKFCSIPPSQLFDVTDLTENYNSRLVVDVMWSFYQYVQKPPASPQAPPRSTSQYHKLQGSPERTLAIQDFIENEQNYVDALKIVDKFRDMLINRDVLKPQEMDVLFGNLPQLFEFHRDTLLKQLIESCESMRGSDGNIRYGSMMVGPIVYGLMDSLFDEYRKYMKKVVVSHDFLSHSHIEGMLKSFLDTFQNSQYLGGGQPLSSFLLLPLTRFSDYNRLLNSILRETASSSPDFEALTMCLQRIQPIIDESTDTRTQLFNFEHGSRTRQASQEDNIDEIPAAVPRRPSGAHTVGAISNEMSLESHNYNASSAVAAGNHAQLTNLMLLAVPGRRFICKGSAWEVINSSLVKERCLFLFSDMLLVAKELKNLDSANQNEVMRTYFQVKSVVNLKHMDLRLSRDDDPHEKFMGTPLMARASVKFERNPRKGVQYLIDHNVVSANPVSVAEFLYRNPILNKHGLGRFISASDNHEILTAYLTCFDFSGLRLDEALRLFFATFRPPGEAKAMDAVLDAFSAKYHIDNPTILSSQELTLKLVFGLLMVNAEMHRRDDGYAGRAKISSSDFIARFRTHDTRGELPDETLILMYQSISTEKLGVAPVNEEEEQDKIKFQVTRIPFRLTMREQSINIAITIPSTDPELSIRIYCHTGLKAIPDVLNFAGSSTATFSLKGSSLGRKGVSFIKSGKTSTQYAASSLPHGKFVIVEPPFMKHVFQLKAKKRDPITKRKISYMFSVANSTQRDNWADQMRNVLDALKQGRELDYGYMMDDETGQQILEDFSTPPQGAHIVPTDQDLALRQQ